jgi:hypothetical protein
MTIASKLALTRAFASLQAIKSPTFIIGLELARQAGNSVLADITLGNRQKRSHFSSISRPA